MPDKCKDRNEYVIGEKFGWWSIFIHIFMHSIKSFLLFGLLDFCIYLIINKYVHALLVYLFWCVLITNHEFGHFVVAKVVKKNDLPIILKIKRRKYIIYSIENCTDADIVKVRSNAIKYDFLTILIGISICLTPICIVARATIILLAIFNLLNYFIWIKGSDGYVIKEYIKKYGLKKFLSIVKSRRKGYGHDPCTGNRQ